MIDSAVLASRFINQTGKNIFLTGKAGTGKTTFLKKIILNTHKKAVIVAPTGIAAINAGGVTIHSLFQLPFGSFVPTNHLLNNSFTKITDQSALAKHMQMGDHKRKLLRELELLIIDEVSMLRADILDAMDFVLRYIRRQRNIPFGGVQVLFIGDLLQLPPVVKDDEWSSLREFYSSIFFFDAHVIKHEKPVYLELEKIYRQGDDRFVELLNNLRNNSINAKDVDLLNVYYKPDFKALPQENYITLTTHNYKANKLNLECLTELKSKAYLYQAEITGEFLDNNFPLEKKLELKLGAQVMFVKNDSSGQQRFFNGKIGVVSSLSDSKIEVKFDDKSPSVSVEKYEWENIRYAMNPLSNEIEEKVIGTFSHFPIKLAWAITVHKSQGLTFEKAIIDIGDAFAMGQVYVALSRLRSLEGLVLTSKINYNSIRLDENVHVFSKNKATADFLEKAIEQESLAYLRGFLLRSFDFGSIERLTDEHFVSYSMDEKRSVKQNHKDWAENIHKKISSIKPHADKFRIQIARIIESNVPDYLEMLEYRVKAAKEYFIPVFQEISTDIFNHIEEIKSSTKIKAYFKELIDLETAFFEQKKTLQKSYGLINSITCKVEYKGEDVKQLIDDSERKIQLSKAYTPAIGSKEVLKKEKREKRPKKEKVLKEPKKDTKEVSFEMFNAGRGIEDIAQERKLGINTIEGHLAYYVAKGELKATRLVPMNKLDKIISVYQELKTLNTAPLKTALGDGFSYGEIKIALAHFLSESSSY